MKLPILLVLLGNHPTFVASSTLQAIVAAKKLRGVVKQRSSPRVDKTDASDNKGHNSLRASPSVESHGVVDEEHCHSRMAGIAWQQGQHDTEKRSELICFKKDSESHKIWK